MDASIEALGSIMARRIKGGIPEVDPGRVLAGRGGFVFRDLGGSTSRTKHPKAFGEGVEAYRCLVSTNIPVLCPYPPDGGKWVDWQKGYEAEKKRLRRTTKAVNCKGGICHVQEL